MFARITGFFMSIVFFICSLLGINLGKIDSKEMIQYNESKTLLNIVLEENGTTGYLWSQEAQEDNVIKLTEDKTLTSSEKNVLGAPSTRVFTFKPLAEGKTILTFSYARSWEDEPIRVVKISVEVSAYMTLCAELISDTSK